MLVACHNQTRNLGRRQQASPQVLSLLHGRRWSAIFFPIMKKLLCAILCVSLPALPCVASEPPAQPSPVKLTAEGRRWAKQTLKKLSLEEKVGQMLSLRYFTDFQNVDSDAYKQFRDQMRRYHVGSVVLTVHVDGPMLLKNPPLEVASMANQLQRDSALPLLIAADFERGLASRVSGVPAFPDAMAFGATANPEYAERLGAITATEARALGIHWDFSPVADVNSNPDNPIINTRSFGEDPQQVGEFVAAFVRGAKAHGMLTTAKHFPGHGDTGTDSHLGVAKVTGDRERLNHVELQPFKKAIDAGVDAVMVAHLAVPALDPDPDKVATVSPRVVNGVLKEQLGFKNLVVTDAMEMRGLTSLYPPEQGNPSGKAAIDAVKAGDDVILWPTDVDGAFRGIVDAVKRGEIPQSRIDEAVQRILEMKAAVGLHRERLVDLAQVPHRVSRQQDLEFAQQVADDAITLVRDSGRLLPLSNSSLRRMEGNTPVSPLAVLILTDSIRGESGRVLENALKARRPDAAVFYVDNTLAPLLTEEVLRAVRQAERVVVAVYVTPVAGKQVMVNGKLVNSVGLEQASQDLVTQVLNSAGARTVVLAMGSPYIAQSLTSAPAYICAYSSASTSEISAVKLLFGELQPHGKLPVTLPGIAPKGVSVPGNGK
jgi:beta-N-acetylhexosaminidase